MEVVERLLVLFLIEVCGSELPLKLFRLPEVPSGFTPPEGLLELLQLTQLDVLSEFTGPELRSALTSSQLLPFAALPGLTPLEVLPSSRAVCRQGTDADVTDADATDAVVTDAVTAVDSLTADAENGADSLTAVEKYFIKFRK